MNEKLLNYFGNDELAANVWLNKYALKDNDGKVVEETPNDMHRRLAKKFYEAEMLNMNKEAANEHWKDSIQPLSEYGKTRKPLTEEDIFNLFKGFKYIIPQGSIMQMLGNDAKIGSLSNCFVIGQPVDSYGGIMQKDQEQVQLMKRRGGVGMDISSLRPKHTKVNNAALTSSGAASFMNRFSNSTREVAQDGRRGALMLTLNVRHPDIFDFVDAKLDLTKVTGANISVMIHDDFIEAVKNETHYILRYPVDIDIQNLHGIEYNTLYSVNDKASFIKIRARELWNKIISAAHKSAEPGVMFIDNHWNYSPDGVYPRFKGISTNPCFHPDTLIETIEGRKKIKDITVPTMVYSMDENGKLCIKNASASFISKKNAETLHIQLKSGSFIKVTDDHMLYVHDKGWVKAIDIELGDRIVHLSRNRRGAKYSGVKLTTQGIRDYVMEHQLVYSAYHNVPIDSNNVHHKDGNTFENTIDNLELLTHSEHSRHTATFQNPQTHQVRDNNGKFISGEDSRKGRKEIINIPDELKTNLLSRHHNAVIRIERGDTTDVYDIQVEDTHCLIANNMVAHNCGEIFMGEYDACRLMAINLLSFVENPYTPKASFNIEKLYEVAYEQQRLDDDLVDLEIAAIDKIIEHIDKSPESAEIKAVERNLWLRIKETAKAGRRTGSGFTALGDVFAAMNIEYGSENSQELLGHIMRTKFTAELDCTIDLAVLRGHFEGYDADKEFILTGDAIDGYVPVGGQNPFYHMLYNEFPEQASRMMKYGRRNISWSTLAPTGSVSILTQTTSGIEPIFQVAFKRRKKINANDSNVRVDFIDDLGDKYQEFNVIHPQLQNWYNINFPEHSDDLSIIDFNALQEIVAKSPWFGSTSDVIDVENRIKIQSIVQKYTTHSISSTLNLPKDTTVETISNIYMMAKEYNLKGITVYRDGSRSGILVNDSQNAPKKFIVQHAVKRPVILDSKMHFATVKGKNHVVIIGLLEGKPYEMFSFTDEKRVNKVINGKTIKVKKGKYMFKSDDGEFVIENLVHESDVEEQASTLYVSQLLRHGTPITHVIKTMKKVSTNVTSFTAAVTRVLSLYVPNGTQSAETCHHCGNKLTYENGCSICKNCGQGGNC